MLTTDVSVEVVRPSYTDPRTATAVEAIAQAFRHDPLIARAGMTRERHRSLLRKIISKLLAKHERHQLVYATSCGNSAAVVCRSDLYGKDGLSLWELITSGAIWDLLPFPKAMRIFQSFTPATQKALKAAQVGPYLKVVFVGTVPENQRQGLGGALLDAINRDADALGLPLYLEAGNEECARLYARKGYKTLDRLQAMDDSDGQPAAYMPLMLRWPGAGPQPLMGHCAHAAPA